jgi:hypothetical protein
MVGTGEVSSHHRDPAMRAHLTGGDRGPMAVFGSEFRRDTKVAGRLAGKVGSRRGAARCQSEVAARDHDRDMCGTRALHLDGSTFAQVSAGVHENAETASGAVCAGSSPVGSAFYFEAKCRSATHANESFRSAIHASRSVIDWRYWQGNEVPHHPCHGSGRRPTSAKAAQAIIAVAESHDPPALLVLGQDALNSFQGVLDAERAELNTWEDVTVSTGFNRSLGLWPG